MDLTETAAKKVQPLQRFWPTPQDYNEALQNPTTAFCDPELKSGECVTDSWGLPRPVSGAFASVYQLKCGDRTYAVRCFLHDVVDQQARYEQISRFVMNDDLDCTVTFEFQKKGVLIQGQWYPILKMEWVHGLTLDQYLEQHLRDGGMLEKLRNSFAEMHQRLRTAGVAHGDLQHGNIMVTASGDLRLVDYDGMFVPSMKGLKSNELGHRNYQHPERNANHFDETIDTFAAWSIFTAITVAAHCPRVYAKYNGGNDCLLFRRKDYEDVWSSAAFAEIDALNLVDLKRLSNGLKWLATLPRPKYLALHDSAPACKPPRRQIAKSSSLAGGSVCSVRPDANIEVEQWWTEYLKDRGRPIVHCDIEPDLRGHRRKPVLRCPSSIGLVEIGAFGILGGVIFLPLMVQSTLLLLFGLFAVLVVDLIAMWPLLKERSLVSSGLPVPGIVESKEVEEWTVEDEKKVRYKVFYSYPVRSKNGRIVIHEKLCVCDKASFDTVAKGESVTVLHNEHVPGISTVYVLARYKVQS